MLDTMLFFFLAYAALAGVYALLAVVLVRRAERRARRLEAPEARQPDAHRSPAIAASSNTGLDDPAGTELLQRIAAHRRHLLQASQAGRVRPMDQEAA